MRSPRFSIVVPMFESARFVGEALLSLANQSCRDFEVIVVDDGSSDDSELVAEMALRKFGLPGTVGRRPDHAPKGVSSCRNAGVALATAEWVAFLDSDDRFKPMKLERVALILANAGPEVVGVHHPATTFDDESGLAGQVIGKQPTASETTFDALLDGNFIATSTVVARRRALAEHGGFDTALNGVEDYWLWLRLARTGVWRALDEPLTEYRLRYGSLMQHREFSHYATQYSSLLRVAARSGQLSSEQIARLRRYLLGTSARHFAGEGFARDGWSGLMRGVSVLAKAGFISSAASILLTHLKGSLVTKALRLYHSR